MKQLSLLLLPFVLFTACSKEPGEGGNSVIRGKVFGYDINTSEVVTDSGYVGGLRVYISYGDNTTADNDVRTSYTGEYEFRGLRKGKYTIFTYSQCNGCLFNQEVKKTQVEITENKQEVEAPQLVIFD